MPRNNTKARRTIPFHKMHGLGNDFVVLDRISNNIELTPQEIAAWGDRHTGIGFDQLLMIDPPTDPEADFWFRIYNADGTEAQQCGNGTRAVALLVHQLGLAKKATLRWQSPGGSITTTFHSPSQIETTMTVPVLAPAEIPFNPAAATQLEGHQFGLAATINDEAVEFTVVPVSMGNPHAVLFVDDLFATDVAAIGSALTRHPAYPEGVNVGFCQIVDQQFVRLRVFERGVGETQACGSGACAAVVAARLLERVGARVKVSLPGGKLRIAWPGPGQAVTMAGTAAYVFRGEFTFNAER